MSADQHTPEKFQADVGQWAERTFPRVTTKSIVAHMNPTPYRGARLVKTVYKIKP